MQRTRGYDPEPFDVPPIFQSPPRPMAMVRWYLTKFLWPQSLLWIGIAAVVYHERAAFGGLDTDVVDHELHLLEELVHVMDEAGATFDGASLDDIRGWVAEAASHTGDSAEAAAA